MIVMVKYISIFFKTVSSCVKIFYSTKTMKFVAIKRAVNQRRNDLSVIVLMKL